MAITTTSMSVPSLNPRQSSGLSIDYESEDFPVARNLSTATQLRVTWDDILWAALTLGRPNLNFVFQHGQSSRYEALFRLSAIRMALEQRPNGRKLRRTSAFKALDPTEKGALNYFIGMTFCKVFADRLLHTPWLLHLDVFRHQLTPTLLGGRSRPDFVGYEPRAAGWHAFESKGRVSKPRREEKEKAKAQAERLVNVGGQACGLHIGAITYFSGDTLRFYWRDPEPERAEVKAPLVISVPEGAWANHYAPITALIRDRLPSTLATQDGAVDLIEIEEANVSIGAHPKILHLLVSGLWDEAHREAIAIASRLKEDGFRPDGLIVKAGDTWRRPLVDATS